MEKNTIRALIEGIESIQIRDKPTILSQTEPFLVCLHDALTELYNMKTKDINKRLEYLRGEILAERISYEEIAELQSLKEHISSDDVLLLEWAGVEEHA